jgi:hypothetical protein
VRPLGLASTAVRASTPAQTATVTAVDDESITLEAAPGVSLRYARGAIARVTNKVASEPEDTDGESDPAKSIEQA